MSFTSIATSLSEPVLLLVGLALLNWIFKPPYHDSIDFLFMLIAVAVLWFFAAWGVILNYGVEVI